MLNVPISTPYVQLGQFLKLTNAVGAGGQAKPFLLLFEVLVNGQVERRRGRKLYAGDTVAFSGKTYVVVRGE